jgi:hypothetical protein
VLPGQANIHRPDTAAVVTVLRMCRLLHTVHCCVLCVLQANIYSPDRTFYSFKQVVRELDSGCMLVSLHSTSKVGQPWLIGCA